MFRRFDLARQGKYSLGSVISGRAIISDAIETLVKMGFEKAGHFELTEKSARYIPERIDEPGVYVFVVEEDIRYVGETGKPVSKRYAHYGQKPVEEILPKYNQFKLNEELAHGKHAEVLLLSDAKIAKVSVSLRLGGDETRTSRDRKLVERFMISLFHPKWNKN